MELIDVVVKLVGPVDPVGETHTDDRRLDNLIVLRDLTRELLDRIESVAEASGGHMASVKVAKDCAASFLADVRAVTVPAALTDEAIYEIAEPHGLRHALIWQDDGRSAAACNMEKDARWSASSVRAEQTIAFARALLAHVSGVAVFGSHPIRPADTDARFSGVPKSDIE